MTLDSHRKWNDHLHPVKAAESVVVAAVLGVTVPLGVHYSTGVQQYSTVQYCTVQVYRTGFYTLPQVMKNTGIVQGLVSWMALEMAATSGMIWLYTWEYPVNYLYQ